jgi:hypothetical protein
MATAKNDITGDLIASRVKSKSYDENYDNIFPENYGIVESRNGEVVKKCSKRCWVEFVDDKPTCIKPNCGGIYGRN